MKRIALEFGTSDVCLHVPDHAAVLTAGSVAPLADPAAAVRRALAEPIGTASLAELARGKASATIVVSDMTRPVPYRGSAGILTPIIDVLRTQNVNDICVLVATGTHRAMTDDELREMLDPAVFAPDVRVVNHICTDPGELVNIGSTAHTPEVTVNRHYLAAELKIVTGLVEPHFMAGYSGGRKAVCPGICGQSVTYGFHSARMLDHDQSTSLMLDGNPCHAESLAVARMAGVDFCVNATIDREKRLAGVFAGELEQAHRAAVDHCNTFATIGVSQQYDVVVTHTGHVGMNHYQSGKAAVEAGRATKPGGRIVLLANHHDTHPLGSEHYQKMVGLLAQLGPGAFRERILADDWSFTPDQWGAQMWVRVFKQLGDPKRLAIVSPRLAGFASDAIAETNVAAGRTAPSGLTEVQWAEQMLQETVDTVLDEGDSCAVLLDGPYATPVQTEPLMDTNERE